MNKNITHNSESSFLYFINFLNHQLDNKLKNSRITTKTLERLIEIYKNILLSKENVNFIIQKQDNMELSFCLNIIQAYHLIFQNNNQLLITSNSGKIIFDNLIMAMQLVNISYGLKNDIDLNSTKTVVENESTIGGKSKLIKSNPYFDINIIRKDEKFNIIIFDNWELKNAKKIKDILIELNDQNAKVIVTIKHNDDNATDLLKSLESSIIVNKLKIN